VVSLVEKAAETIEQDEAEKLAKKMQAGKFDMDDFASQLRQMLKMGGLSGMMGLLPGVGKIKDQLKDAKIDDSVVNKQLAIISSMTKQERKRPELIKASRKQRIAKGSGTTVQEVNKLMKQHMEANRMMKKVKKMGKKGLMRHGLPGMPPGGMGGGGMGGGGRGPFG
jgi:signal recognition particle subunit SRP54